ncbi:MAG: SpoIIE family protein phosphatase [Firmicutes bacterium]|nr:SpoIIE family protein phosphatase [Bacillota bacterium]
MYDWVRVLDLDCNIIYINKAMAEHMKVPVIGKKCYEAFNRSEPCENCVSCKSLQDVKTYEKEEVFEDKVFSVMSSPVKNSNGDIIAVVEVLRDITKLKQLQQKIIEQNKELHNDLDMARKLQLSLLPSKLPKEKLNISFIYKPSEMLGGDFIDIFEIDKDHWGIYIADVSGHGVLASLLTVFLRSTIAKDTLSPAEALTGLYNEFNIIGFDTNLYITIFYSIIDLKNRALTYSNAGHNICPIVYSNSRFEILRKPGIPISDWMDKPGYTDDCINLNKGDRIFYSSDGIVEIKNSSKEQFGEERLLGILLNDKSEPDTVLNNIITNAFNFAGIESMAELCDDITMVLLEII